MHTVLSSAACFFLMCHMLSVSVLSQTEHTWVLSLGKCCLRELLCNGWLCCKSAGAPAGSWGHFWQHSLLQGIGHVKGVM